MNYYNEFDPKAAAWLRELIKAGLIPPGDVDERSISDILPNDLSRYTQCHFFAGIGGWSLALQLAGWPSDRPVWTGSCPCQPFSNAGKRRGTDDERHLWPEFFRLISECRPTAVFGEQVASKDGREWLSGVFADLEGVAYAVAGADLCAAGVGAPHIRQRLYWMANAELQRCKCVQVERCSCIQFSAAHAPAELPSDASDSGLGESNGTGWDTGQSAAEAARHGSAVEPTGSFNAWSNFDIVQCLDGKARRVESGAFPLAHGVPGRVGLLRGYGNAIVPQTAAEFITAAKEAIGGEE